jgi:serine phosphatase RsbU (regulator of sigma subunit)/anti-sigma regulatory factor (Ser/Thr protein kinase)
VDFVAAATYDPEPAAVTAARHFVRDTLTSWGVQGGDNLLADAELLTSEFVTNAVLHARTPVQVTCRADRSEVEVSVLDWQPGRPDAGGTEPAADVRPARGGGLLLPAALSSSWGVTYGPAARTAWFRIRADRTADADPSAGQTVADRASESSWRARRQPSGASADADLLRLGYPELHSRTAELARDSLAADAAYVLVADDDGMLRIRAAAGLGAPSAQAWAAERTTAPTGQAGGPAGQAGGPAGQADEPAEQAGGPAGQERELAGHGVGAPGGPAGLGTFLAVYNLLAENGAEGAHGLVGLPPSFLTAPVVADGRVAAVLAVMAADPDRFTDDDAARLQDVADQVAEPLGRAWLHEQDQASRARTSFLAEASELLAGTLDTEQTIALGAQLVVPRLASWSAFLLPGGDGNLRPAHVWHADEARIDALSDLLNHARVLASLRAGGPQRPLARLPDDQMTQEAADLAGSPVRCFPLLARGRNLGMLVMGQPRGGAFGGQAMDLAENLTRRVALALDNARLYSEQLQASHALQRSLLPPSLPAISGLDVAAGYQAAGEQTEVGGDFYDIFEIGHDRWRFAIGDVCGKGLEAAAVTGLTRHALRILAREGHDVPTVLERLNALILEEGSAVPFVTLIHGEIVLRAGGADFRLACAGHPPPLLMSASGTRVAADSQPLLGVMEDATYRCDTCHVRPGDVLLCVTDGVTERRSGDRLLDDDNGLRRLLADCSELNAGAIVARIQREVYEFGIGPPADDMALLVFRGEQKDAVPAELS